MPPGQQMIDRIWAGHPVGFGFIADDVRLYVAYYDARRELTLATRDLQGGPWRFRSFPSKIGWDSHKYIALALDDHGRLHMAANMHVTPLNYYIMHDAGDLNSMRKWPALVDAKQESRVTYPEFLHLANGDLVFKFRDGRSGNGNTLYYCFDGAAMTWRDMTGVPILDGGGERNAYPVGPARSNKGWFHLAWVWRENRMAESNHSLCHAMSRDLVHWHAADGKPLTLPITLASAPVVDPVPQGGGIINNNTLVGFDRLGRPLISYHKYDDRGQTQIYLARHEKRRWHIVQASDWQDYRWDFSGPGTLEFDIMLTPAHQRKDQLIVPVVRAGKPSDLLLDATTLERQGEVERPVDRLHKLVAAIDTPDGMERHALSLDSAGKTYILTWATLPTNRDRPRKTHPAPTGLHLLETSPIRLRNTRVP